MRVLIYIIAAIAFLLVTFFGLGPVIFSDGTMSERLVTLLVVVLLYLLLICIVAWIKKKEIKK